MKLLALALTAGLGTRLRPHTLLRAKPAIPFVGVPLGLHALRHLESVKPDALYLNLHYRPHDIRSLDTGMLHLPEARYSDEGGAILGSAGALNLVVRQQTADHYLLCNGDEVLLPADPDFLAQAFQDHQKSGRIATLVTMKHPEVGVTLGGAWTGPDLKVKAFSKKPIAGTEGNHYVGYLFLADRVRKFLEPELVEENILYGTLTKAMATGEEVACYDIKAHWYETGEAHSFLDSSRLVLDVLEKESATREAADLRHFLARFASFQFQIEATDSALSERLASYLKEHGRKSPKAY